MNIIRARQPIMRTCGFIVSSLIITTDAIIVVTMATMTLTMSAVSDRCRLVAVALPLTPPSPLRRRSVDRPRRPDRDVVTERWQTARFCVGRRRQAGLVDPACPRRVYGRGSGSPGRGRRGPSLTVVASRTW